jgi:hypothetical protein
MSYEKDQFGGVGGGEPTASISSMILTAIAGYVTSASLATALAAYAASNSVSAMIAGQIAAQPNYVTSNSASAMIVTALAPYAASNSVSAMIAGQIAAQPNYVTSNSASAMIVTALTPYLTSASAALSTYLTSSSFATAIGPYLTSASAGLSAYLTSGSFATAIAPYVTSASLATTLGGYVTSSSLSTALGTYLSSASASTVLATKHPSFNVQDEGVTLSTVAGVVTQINFVGTGISASLTGGLLTVTAVAGAGSGEGSVSISTMITTRLALDGGMVLLGSVSASIGLAGTFGFSGSWSDYAMLELRATYRPNGTSLTASAAIYTDGGTTPMLPLLVGTVSQGAFYHVTLRTYLGGGFKSLQHENATAAARTQGHTATSNTGFVNCIRLQHGTAASATISVGFAQLYGLRR